MNVSKKRQHLSFNIMSYIRNDVRYSKFYDEDDLCLDDGSIVYPSEHINCEKKKSKTNIFRLFKTRTSLRFQDNSFFNKERFSRAIESVHNKLFSISQDLRKSNKSIETPVKCVTPTRRTRHILGRTPIKLYSPFAIETPSDKNTSHHPEIYDCTPVKFSNVEHVEKKKKRKSKGARNLFRKVTTNQMNYYKL